MTRFFLIAFCFALWPCPAHAQSPAPLVVELEYRAPPSCPDVAAFRRQVLERTARVRFDESSGGASWTVVVADTKGGSAGTLHISGTELERKVSAANCNQVVAALALVAALSVDPDASLMPARAAPSPPVTVTPESDRARPSAPAPPPRQTRFSAGLTLTARGGIAPGLAWAPRPFVGVSFRSSSGHSFGFELSATRVHTSIARSAGRADFEWTAGRLECFPLRLELADFRFEPAMFVDAGLLRARGVGVDPVAEVQRPTVALGALGRISVLAFGVLLLEVEAGPVVPLIRDRFYLQQNSTVYRVPAVTGFGAAGVGLEFL